MASQLDIYVESKRRFSRSPFYKLGQMLLGLEKAGMSSRIIDRPDTIADPAPAAFFHVDLTDLPANFVRAADRYDHHINGEVSSIRKSLYSDDLLSRGSDFAGPVIVKTDLNFRGIPEARYQWEQSLGGWARHIARTALDRGYIEKSCPEYRVYQHLEKVPDEVWADDRLIVEPFYPGTLEPPVIKHRYDFFFDSGLPTRSTFSSPMCEEVSLEKFEILEAPAREVLDLKDRLNLDYGAIDYFETRDGVKIIDANKTVSITMDWVAEYPQIARHLADATEQLVQFVRNA